MPSKQNIWFHVMAEKLVCDITQQMADIQLTIVVDPLHTGQEKELVGVHATISGDLTFEVQFFAEHALFYRLTGNMMGEVPTEEDIQEYATEYFNVLCGRFLSELVAATRIKTRFLPVKYEFPVRWKQEDSMCVLNFISDSQECASFSWTEAPIAEILRRSSEK